MYPVAWVVGDVKSGLWATHLICGEALDLTLLQRRHDAALWTEVYYFWFRVAEVQAL